MGDLKTPSSDSPQRAALVHQKNYLFSNPNPKAMWPSEYRAALVRPPKEAANVHSQLPPKLARLVELLRTLQTSTGNFKNISVGRRAYFFGLKHVSLCKLLSQTMDSPRVGNKLVYTQ